MLRDRAVSAVEARSPAPAPSPSRPAPLQYRLLWLLAGLAACALIAKIALDVRAAGLERDVVTKQQFVNQTMPISRLNVQLIQLLANVAASTGDPDIRVLLDTQGIQYSVKQQP